MGERLTLYGYWRSSAAYRVRIALNLKRLPYDTVPVHLVNNGGEQHDPAYHALNPQELVPVLIDGGHVVRQSMAIIEYLDEAYEGPIRLLPAAIGSRARVRALAQLIACDVHPLGNLRVLQYLERDLSTSAEQRERWIRHWIGEGLRAFEEMVAGHASTGRFCNGDQPGLAEACLIPQLYNAHRFRVELAPYPTIARIEQACLALPAFDAARPENQPDAPAAAA